MMGMKNPDDPNETMDPDLLTKQLLREEKKWPRNVIILIILAGAGTVAIGDSFLIGGMAILAVQAAHASTFRWLRVTRNEVSELREKIEALSAAQGAD